MSKRPYILELYTDRKGWYRWRLKRGGYVVADSAESYVTKQTLRRAAGTLLRDLFSKNVKLREAIERLR